MMIYNTHFLVYLPEDLGIIGNVVSHIQTEKGCLDTTASHISRYDSKNGLEWFAIFTNYDDCKIEKFHSLKSSVFSFPITIWDGVNGEFYITFTSWKDDELTSYYTEKKYFTNNQFLKVW